MKRVVISYEVEAESISEAARMIGVSHDTIVYHIRNRQPFIRDRKKMKVSFKEVRP